MSRGAKFVGGDGLEEIRMLLGERRRLTLVVTIGESSEFEISNATYLLQRGETEMENGAAVVDGHDIYVYLEPKEAGCFRLTVTFSVGGEIIKKRVLIRVEA